MTRTENNDRVKEAAYKTLGLRKGASLRRIQKAYHCLAMQNHPDRNVGNDSALTAFKEVTEAYNILIGKVVTPDNSDNKAYEVLSQVLCSVLAQVLSSNQDPKTVDMVSLMKNGILNGLKGTENHLESLEKNKTGLQAIRDRFTGDDVESINGIIDFHLHDIDRQISAIKDSIMTTKRAKKLLDSLKYRKDKTSGSGAGIPIAGGSRTSINGWFAT